MKLIPILLTLLVLITGSCKKHKPKIVIPTISRDTLKSNSTNKKTLKRIVLKPNTKKELKNWKEYKLVDEILSKFNTVSNEEALSNSKELSELVTHLKDSITDKRLESPPLKARFNILHNECLRLNDMTTIPAITSEEVRAEIVNIYEAFTALNDKLNAVFEVRNMENELELDPDFERILNDSTHIRPAEKNISKPIKIQKKKKSREKIERIKRKGFLNKPIK